MKWAAISNISGRIVSGAPLNTFPKPYFPKFFTVYKGHLIVSRENNEIVFKKLLRNMDIENIEKNPDRTLWVNVLKFS